MKKWYLLIIATMLASGMAQAGSCGGDDHAEKAACCGTCQIDKAACDVEKAECAVKDAACDIEKKAECATEKKCCGTCKVEKAECAVSEAKCATKECTKKWYNPLTWFK